MDFGPFSVILTIFGHDFVIFLEHFKKLYKHVPALTATAHPEGSPYQRRVIPALGRARLPVRRGGSLPSRDFLIFNTGYRITSLDSPLN